VKRIRSAIIILIVLVAASVISALPAQAATPINSPTRPASSRIPALNFRAARPIFPYSIIPGGVRSGKELEDSIAADPVAAKHYAGISPHGLMVQRLKRDIEVFSSYRLGNNVYWTNHTIHVRAGELVLTDGANLIRARCGNRLVRIPPGPPSPTPSVEPPDIVYEAGTPSLVPPSDEPPALVETPEIAFTATQTLVPSATPVPPRGDVAPPIYGVVLPPWSGCCTNTTQDQPPPTPPLTPVPEPSSLVLFIAGLGVGGAYARRFWR